EVHSHTHSHTRWDLIASSEQAKIECLHDDLLKSRQTLEHRLASASRHLCWPQGYFDDDYVRIAKDLGFDHLYTTDARGQNRVLADPSHIYPVAIRNRPYPWMRQRTWLATHPVLGPLYNQWKGRKRKPVGATVG